MNVDISPDGKSLVFDLLGDLYTLPVEGGHANLLRGGVSWDVQPRFSPSGKYVLYNSDASGCENIWRLDLSTGKSSMITNETYRSVSNAVWNDNDETIIAVKFYTSSRSIGAGEIWKYSVEDGSTSPGVRVLGRRHAASQIGPEEPFVSNGYLYYSQNTMDSEVYEYSKNVYAGIYSLLSVNLSAPISQPRVLYRGAGGAARPIVSKDGRFLAYIQRQKFETILVVRDLEDGHERIINRDLSHDLQGSSAVSRPDNNVLSSSALTNLLFLAKRRLPLLCIHSRE
jgi:hypothetical protein